MTIANFTRRLIQLTLGPLLLFGGLAGTGCSQETAESDDEVSSTDSRLDFETYRASLKQESEGLYVVDDMLLDLQRLEEYFALRYPAPNALVVRKSNATRTIWTDPARSDLAWCVSNDFGSNQDKVVTAMQAATKGWQTEAGAGLVFRYASAQNGNCNTDNTNVRIAVVLDSSMTDAYGKSPVGPPTTGRQFTQIRLSPAALSAWDLDVASFGSLDLAAVVAHELGHSLGFYHEQSRKDSNCYDGTWDSSHEQLTSYDPISIMHYVWVQNANCTPTNKLWLTPLDGVGARAVYPGGTTPAPVCKNRSYGRGAGTVPTCGAGNVLDAGLCYSSCPAGYTGVGPVCWQNCPSGYRDDGAFCFRDASIISANTSSCPWYDVCGIALARGCSRCPSGYANDGCTCRRDAHSFAKTTVARGVGSLPSKCGSTQQLDAGLCYAQCTLGFKGIGPVCWEQCN